MTRVPSHQWAQFEMPALEERYQWSYFIGLTTSVLRGNVSQLSFHLLIIEF